VSDQLATAGGTLADEIAVPQRAELLWVEGEDARTFLNGLLTNDVDALSTGQSQRSVLLDPKGRVRTLVRVVRDSDDSYTLVLLAGDGEQMRDDLDRYHFSEAIDILGPEPVETLVVDDASAALVSVSAELDVIGWVPGTRELVTSELSLTLAALDRAASPPEVLDALRIRTCTPMPNKDFGESALVQELGIESASVSFTKGCYLGQETVARVAHRGKVNRRLRRLELDGEPLPGSTVTLVDSEVGSIGTVAQQPSGAWSALALLRERVPDGALVRIGPISGRVTPPAGSLG
jgi:folate-binding protein YgfZ